MSLAQSTEGPAAEVEPEAREVERGKGRAGNRPIVELAPEIVESL